MYKRVIARGVTVTVNLLGAIPALLTLASCRDLPNSSNADGGFVKSEHNDQRQSNQKATNHTVPCRHADNGNFFNLPQLRRFLSGRNFSPISHKSTSPALESFAEGGNWKGLYSGIDYALRDGKWRIYQSEYRQIVCVYFHLTAEEMEYGRRPEHVCRDIFIQSDDIAVISSMQNNDICYAIKYTRQNVSEIMR